MIFWCVLSFEREKEEKSYFPNRQKILFLRKRWSVTERSYQELFGFKADILS